MNHSKALETSVLPVNGCWAPLTPNFGTHHVSILKFDLFGFLGTVATILSGEERAVDGTLSLKKALEKAKGHLH